MVKKLKVLIFILIAYFSVLKSNHSYGFTNPYFLVYMHPSGLGATLASILGALDFYETHDCAGIEVILSKGAYYDPARGPNWWEYFFEPINIGVKDKLIYTFTIHDHGMFVGVLYRMDRIKANNYIKKYIHVKPEILEELDLFVENHFKDHFVIGVHHRGTDKKMEIPLVPYEKTIHVLNQIINYLPNELKERLKIYVATDEQKFLDLMVKLYPDLIIYSDFVRSTNDKPLHWGNNDKFSSIYQKGKEALMDCLLLSKTGILIRPESTLSIISGCFNPDLIEVILTADKQ